MLVYKDFIDQNVATTEAKKIAVCQDGRRVVTLDLGPLQLPRNRGAVLYSFGAISDVHLQYETAQDDFRRALTFLAEERMAFVCVAGDLTANGSHADLAQYKQYVQDFSGGVPVYAITGNHECWSGLNLASEIEQYTGKPLYYTVSRGDDLFIMLGLSGDGSGNLFKVEELQWLKDTLEANRNRRCFVFMHVRPQDGCGNTFGIYAYDIWGGKDQVIIESLMRHYRNTVWFHGHSHLKFYLQYGSDIANIDRLFGCWSVHIPSLAVPRDGDVAGSSSMKEIYSASEGYVVDVYKDGIHLRGRDFVKGEYLPIASYWLDTTITKIPAGGYVDPSGLIK